MSNPKCIQFRTRKCEHLKLERHFLEFLHGFSVFVNGFGAPRKALI